MTAGRTIHSPPRVLVTDAHRGSAISVIRSLGMRGWEVTAADSHRRSAGLYSKYAAHRRVYPWPLRYPDRTADAMLDMVTGLGIDLVVPVTDETILPVRSIRDRLENVAAVALASEGALAVAADKIATMELATSLGIPTPRHEVARDPADAVRIGDALGWPVVVKPQRSRERTGAGTISRHSVSYAANQAELRHAVANGPVLVQEYLEGQGHGVELLMRDGEPIVAFQHRRLREVPVTGGASAFRVSVPLDPALLEHSVSLLRALHWTGLAMVEFRIGPAGARLMEINGRIWGSLPLAVKCGVDFPAMMADVHLGRRLEPRMPNRYRLGVTSRNLPLEVSWIGAVISGRSRHSALRTPARRDGVKAALRLLMPDGWDVQSRSDPMPGLVEIARVAGDALRRLRHRSAAFDDT